MEFQLLHSIVKGGSAAENWTKEITEVYQLESIDHFNEFLLSLKRKNGCIAEWAGNKLVYFIIDSVNVTKRSPQPGGRVQVEVGTRMRALDSRDNLDAPWFLPPFNFHVSSAINEESASQFYPGDDDIMLNEDDSPFPFINTAGVMLEGTASFATAQIAFSYAISATTFRKIQDWFWTLPGKINNDNVTICGMKFPPRTIRLEAMNAEYEEVELPGRVIERVEIIDGNTIVTTTRIEPVTYHYYRVDATLNANPRTWNQYFLNVGTHVNRGGVIARLWSWDNPQNSGMSFGTYGDYINGGGVNGQSVTEPVALNANGTNASPIGSDGRQIMTYRHGSLYEPISFRELAFPTLPPKKWNQGS